MKKFFSTAVATILFVTCDAFAAKFLIHGQRAYSSKPIDVRVGDRREKREIGPGTVAAVYSDGRVIFYSEEHGPVEFSSTDAVFIEPRVVCPLKEYEMFYSTMYYDSAVQTAGAVVYKKLETGFATVKEVFGDCRRGRALIVPAADDAPRMVPMSSLLREVKCPYSGKHVYQTTYGSGLVREVYGDCKTGPVLFRADRNVAVSVVVPANTLVLP